MRAGVGIDVLIGMIGFLLCFLYDLNSVKKIRREFRSFFAAGTLLITAATVHIFWIYRDILGHPDRVQILLLFCVFLFFAALIYTLFLALPFEATYVNESGARNAYTEGIYALCRHPGVLWFTGMYLSLGGVLRSEGAILFLSLMTVMNIAYVIFQDLWTFPQTFTNYKEYQKSTPFLIPNKKSVRRCIKTLRGETGI